MSEKIFIDADILRKLNYSKCVLSVDEQKSIIEKMLFDANAEMSELESFSSVYSFLFHHNDLWDFDPEDEEDRKNYPLVASLYDNVDIIYRLGGYEGEGDTVLVLCIYKPQNILFLFDGWYGSYSGIEWNDDNLTIIPEMKETTCMVCTLD
jgi:hypothetical protein